MPQQAQIRTDGRGYGSSAVDDFVCTYQPSAWSWSVLHFKRLLTVRALLHHSYHSISLHWDLHTGIRCDVVETQRLNHAREEVAGLSLAALQGIDGIVAVGGDGLFQEVLNGVLAIRHVARHTLSRHEALGLACTRTRQRSLFRPGAQRDIV